MALIQASVSGTGEGVSSTPFQNSATVAGEILPNGLIKIVGTRLYELQFWSPKTIDKVTAWAIKERLIEKSSMLHWTDILAIYLVSLTKTLVTENYPVQYYAGARRLDELELIMIIDAIAASSGTKDWNTIMAAKNLSDPIIDDRTQAGSPFNPQSVWYDPTKPIFTYDPDNHYIIYHSGEIVWTLTGKRYFARSKAVSYDKLNATVRLENGDVLNLITLELSSPDNGTVQKVKQTTMEKPWYQVYAQKLLADTKTQLFIMAGLVLLLIIKAKRSNG
jgi:hypothetical protein